MIDDGEHSTESLRRLAEDEAYDRSAQRHQHRHRKLAVVSWHAGVRQHPEALLIFYSGTATFCVDTSYGIFCDRRKSLKYKDLRRLVPRNRRNLLFDSNL